jgi:hypothetical protein
VICPTANRRGSWGRRKGGRLCGTGALEPTESRIPARTHALERPEALIRLGGTSLLPRFHGPWLRRKRIYGAKGILVLTHRLRRSSGRHARGLHRSATNPVPSGGHRRPRRFRERARHAAHREGRAAGGGIGRPGRLRRGGSERRVGLGAGRAPERGAEEVAEEAGVVGLRDAEAGGGRGGGPALAEYVADHGRRAGSGRGGGRLVGPGRLGAASRLVRPCGGGSRTLGGGACGRARPGAARGGAGGVYAEVELVGVEGGGGGAGGGAVSGVGGVHGGRLDGDPRAAKGRRRWGRVVPSFPSLFVRLGMPLFRLRGSCGGSTTAVGGYTTESLAWAGYVGPCWAPA